MQARIITIWPSGRMRALKFLFLRVSRFFSLLSPPSSSDPPRVTVPLHEFLFFSARFRCVTRRERSANVFCLRARVCVSHEEAVKEPLRLRNVCVSAPDLSDFNILNLREVGTKLLAFRAWG